MHRSSFWKLWKDCRLPPLDKVAQAEVFAALDALRKEYAAWYTERASVVPAGMPESTEMHRYEMVLVRHIVGGLAPHQLSLLGLAVYSAVVANAGLFVADHDAEAKLRRMIDAETADREQQLAGETYLSAKDYQKALQNARSATEEQVRGESAVSIHNDVYDAFLRHLPTLGAEELEEARWLLLSELREYDDLLPVRYVFQQLGTTAFTQLHKGAAGHLRYAHLIYAMDVYLASMLAKQKGAGVLRLWLLGNLCPPADVQDGPYPCPYCSAGMQKPKKHCGAVACKREYERVRKLARRRGC